MSVARTLLAVAALSSATAANAQESASDEVHAGIRLGVSSAFTSGGDVLPLVTAHADIRFVRNRWFLSLSPGLHLPGPSTTLDYGALGLDLGGGRLLGEGTFAPYVGAGVSSRLQFSDDTSLVGFAPYAHAGVRAELSPSAQTFAEVRAYQNVIAVNAGQRAVFPTEVGLAFGLLF